MDLNEDSIERERPQKRKASKSTSYTGEAGEDASLRQFHGSSVPANGDRPSATDHLNRSHLVNALAALIRNKDTQTPLTIGIYGRWGSGKSSFMAQLCKRLDNKTTVVEFNPWRYDAPHAILINLVRAIAPALDQHMSISSRLSYLFQKSSLKSYSKLKTRFMSGAQKVHNWIGVSFLGIGVTGLKTNATPLPADQTASSLLVNWWIALNTGVTDHVPGGLGGLFLAFFVLYLFVKLNNTFRTPFTSQFEACLKSLHDNAEDLKELTRGELARISDLVAKSANKQKNNTPPIVILIDDLDRCSPNNIVNVLEMVNVFLSNLPFIAVLGIDSIAVTHAVAAKYEFMLENKNDAKEKEKHGRLFLEKIINIPFQLSPPKDLSKYIQYLTISASGVSDAEDENQKKIIAINYMKINKLEYKQLSFKDMILYHYIRLTLIFFLKYLNESNYESALSMAVFIRDIFDIKIPPYLEDWVNTLSYKDKKYFERWREMSQKRGKGFPRLLITPEKMKGVRQKIEDEISEKMVEISDLDNSRLQNYATVLHGNPRSIKRFVNSYQLVKGFRSELLNTDPDAVPPSLDSLCAWLVLLQNWPYEGGTLYARHLEGTGLEVLPTQDRPGMSEFQRFCYQNREALLQLDPHGPGHDIPGCFSFVSPNPAPLIDRTTTAPVTPS